MCAPMTLKLELPPQRQNAVSAEHAKFWRDKALGFDLLHATYVKHSFAPATRTKGTSLASLTGAFRPFATEVPRTTRRQVTSFWSTLVRYIRASAAHEAGWTYRPCYPPARALRAVHEELGRRDTPYFPDAVVHDPLLAEKLRAFHRASEDDASLLTRSTALF